jgi:polysaccharide chain length determinant protein (PEP-CTERM system associated)
MAPVGAKPAGDEEIVPSDEITLPEEDQESSLNLNETAGKLVGILARRRWWILLPFCCIALGTVAGMSLLPNRYTSTATLLVVQQQVPQRYVVPNSTTDVASALQAMKQEVLSRTQLLRMINDFGLYPKQRKRLAPEELVALMLSNIDIVPINENPQQAQKDKDFDAFRISFTTESALLAQQVTNTLTSLFINEYLRTGTEQSTNTTNFLHRQVEEKGKLLAAQEAKLADFKLQHVGELPEQQPGNLGILTGLRGELRDTMTSLNRALQQRPLLQAQLEATQKRRPVLENGVPAPIPGNPNPNQVLTPLEVAQNDLVRLQAVRAALQSKGAKPQHPDVLTNEREIAQAEENIKRLRAAAPPQSEKAHTAAPAAAGATPAFDATEEPAAGLLRASLEANRLEIEGLSKDEARLKASIAQYESRLNQTPVREQQQASILRDTENLRLEYAELQKKEQESQLATNLEKQQGGQQFRLIDPASLPALPSSPNRRKISMGGAAGGFFVGLALALLMELRDTSFHTEKDLAEHLDLPFVLGIPLLPTRVEERRRKRRSLSQWAAASAMLLVVAAAEFYVYIRG